MVYLLGLSVTQHIDYQMVFYVFCSSLIFTMIFMMYYFTFVDRPFHSLFLFYHDLKTVTSNLNFGTQGVQNILHFKRAKDGDRLLYEDPVLNGNTGYIGDRKSPNEKSATLFDMSDQSAPRGQLLNNSSYIPRTQ
jgi:hypothetical protein